MVESGFKIFLPGVLFLLLLGVVPGTEGKAFAAGDVVFEKSTLVLQTDAGDIVFVVEMAATAQQRSMGLQYRKKLAPDKGMLFDFGNTLPVAMWMKNTPISLDMLFISDNGLIVEIAPDTTPYSLDIIRSGHPVRFVLELVAGSAARLGIRPGVRIRHQWVKDGN